MTETLPERYDPESRGDAMAIAFEPQPIELGTLDRIMSGDLSGLSEQQRASVYLQVCGGLGLDPRTSPLMFLKDDRTGKVSLYFKAEAADQVIRSRRITIETLREEERGGCIVLHGRACLPNGQWVPAIGGMALTGRRKDGSTYKLEGEQYLHALMKAETRMKRRAVKSLTGFSCYAPDDPECAAMSPLPVVHLPAALQAPPDSPADNEPAPIGTLVREEWTRQFPEGGAAGLREYGERALGREMRPTSDNLGRLADMAVVLADLQGRVLALQGLFGQYETIGRDVSDEAMRKDLGELLGREVPTRATLTARELAICAEMVGDGAFSDTPDV